MPFEGGAAASGLAAAAGGSGGRGSNSVPARRSPLASGGAKAGSIDRQRKLSTEKMIEDEAMDLLLEGMGLEAKLKGFLEAAHGKGRRGKNRTRPTLKKIEF